MVELLQGLLAERGWRGWSRIERSGDASAARPSTGEVSTWHDDDGWGVIESAATPGGCWVHQSGVLAGSDPLHEGQRVLFTFEPAEQDGCSYRAIEAWPEAAEPDRSHRVVGGPSAAYRSALALTFDEPPDAGQPVS